MSSNVFKDGQNVSLQRAINSPRKSVVTGKVVKVSPIKLVKQGTLPVKSLILKDKTTTAKICLFDKNAKLDYQPGNMVEFSAVYPKEYLNVKQLNSTTATKCQFLPPNEEIELLNEDENKKWSDDHDFIQQYTELTDIDDVDLYDVCGNDACRDMKMKDNSCPSCLGTETKGSKYSKMSYLKQFQLESDSNRLDFDKNRIFYRHWLPTQLNNFQQFGPLPSQEGNCILYEEFDTLLHVSSFENAFKIFEDGGFEQQFVKDSSVVNPDIVVLKWVNGCRRKVHKKPHPISKRKILWYGPYSKSKACEPFEEVERYGNVAFNMASLDGPGGLVNSSMNADEFRYYFIEVIDYLTQSACRILVTKFDHPELRVYDPEVVGGPWYYNRTENKHYHLVKILNSDGKLVRNTVEFMREETWSFEAYSTWVMNHQISYKSCSQPRAGVSVDDREWNGRLKLVFGTLAFRFKNISLCFPPPRSFLFNGSEDIRLFIDVFRILHNYANTKTKNVSDSSITFNLNDHSASGISTSDDESEDRVQSVASKMKLTKNFFSKMESSNYRQTGCWLLDHYSSIKNELDSQLLDLEYLVSVVLIFYRSEFFYVSKTFCDIYREMLIFFHPEQITDVFKFLEEKIHCELIGSGVRSCDDETSVHECLD